MTTSGGVTYPRVVGLLTAEVAKKGQRGAARDISIALLSLQRYIKGKGEPTQASLQKLADYFNVSVEYLRGGSTFNIETAYDCLDEIAKAAISWHDRVGGECKEIIAILNELEKLSYIITESKLEMEDVIKSNDKFIKKIGPVIEEIGRKAEAITRQQENVNTK